MQPDESVFLIARAQSPLSLLEQVTAGWWTAILAASVVVITNKRILLFPVNTNGTWKCGLTFKNEKSMILRSISLSGGGYFYTGHPWIGLVPAIAEAILILEIFLLVLTRGSYPGKPTELARVVLTLAVFWGLETRLRFALSTLRL
jgi:hypothetical protein